MYESTKHFKAFDINHPFTHNNIRRRRDSLFYSGDVGDKSQHQSDNRGKSITQNSVLEKYTQVDNTKQPQRHENRDYGVHRVLINWKIELCVLKVLDILLLDLRFKHAIFYGFLALLFVFIF